MNCRRHIFHLAWLLGLLACGAGRAVACNVPVFRYALERWSPEPYEIVILHSQALTSDEQKIVDALKSFGADDQGAANYTVRTLDIAAAASSRPTTQGSGQSGGQATTDATADTATDTTTDTTQTDTDKAIIAAQKSLPLPRLVVAYPAQQFPRPIAWSAPLNPNSARQIMDSPARRKISDGICSGDAAVWLLLESGQAKADDAAFAALRDKLKQIQKDAPPPPSTAPATTQADVDLPPDDGRIYYPTKFSIARISRSDPAESALLGMLLSGDPELAKVTEPMAFVAFGRGRVIGALVGKAITGDSIEEACTFLTGDCSCEVKRQNPGFDILVASDWRPAEEATARTPLPSMAGLAQFRAGDVRSSGFSRFVGLRTA